jgi:hypothetical protein
MNNLRLKGIQVGSKIEALEFFDVEESQVNVCFNETVIQEITFSTFVYTVEGVENWCYAVEAYFMNSNEFNN